MASEAVEPRDDTVISEQASAGVGEAEPLSTADIAGKHEEPVGAPWPTPTNKPTEEPPLFPEDELQRFQSRWGSIQTGFVDDPRRTVHEADNLVAEVMQRLAQVFAEERAHLEAEWERGGDVSTEDLRVALQRYRSFFGRLLAV